MKEYDKNMLRKCPGCGKPVDFSSNPFRPFCSKRCKMADLGAWLKEEYRIAGTPGDYMKSNLDNIDS